MSFYKNVFNWEYQEDNGYYIVHHENDVLAGIYETPDIFKKFKMPHFWMNYIQVKSITEIVNKVEELNGKVEIKNAAFSGGKIALIRDPMGAGFTIYEGDQLKQTKTQCLGHVISRELQTSDLKKYSLFIQNSLVGRLENPTPMGIMTSTPITESSFVLLMR